MMAAFRAFAKSPLAIALTGLLIIAFGLFWNVGDTFKLQIASWVVKAGHREIDRNEFKRNFDLELRNISQQSGQSLSTQEAVARHLDREVLQRLARQETLMEALRRVGVEASPKLVLEELRKIPALFNPVTGRFDESNYRDFLRRNELRDVDFEHGLRDQITFTHFIAGLSTGLRAPLAYTAPYAVVVEQARVADYFLINPRSIEAPSPPTDAQLKELLKQVPRRAETRQISMVRFSAKAVAETLKADPAAVQKRFDFEKSRLSAPERRSFVQIKLKDPRQAADAAQRLARGEDPAAVAKALGTQATPFENVPKNAVPDQRVGEAVFSLQPGKSSGPIQGEFGPAVVKLSAISPAKPATLEDVRPQIEAEVRAEEAENLVYDQVQKYDEAHDSGSPMLQAANAAKVKVFSVGPITAEGKRVDGQPEPALNSKMLADAFALNQGAETEVIDLGKGEYYAIRVEKVTPSAAPTLEEVRPELTNIYMQQEFFRRLQAKADGYAQRLMKGEAFQAVAASAGSPPQHLQGLTRAQASQMEQQIGPELLGKLFQAKAGDAFSARGPNFMAVVKLTQVQSGTPERVAVTALTMQPQFSAQMARADLIEMVLNAARAQVKPKMSEQRARQAIGAQEEPATAPAKGTGKAP